MMKAVDVASVWLKKIKVIKIGVRWIFYALMALFALNALGLFQTLLRLRSSGITFTFELSSPLRSACSYIYRSNLTNTQQGWRDA